MSHLPRVSTKAAKLADNLSRESSKAEDDHKFITQPTPPSWTFSQHGFQPHGFYHRKKLLRLNITNKPMKQLLLFFGYKQQRPETTLPPLFLFLGSTAAEAAAIPKKTPLRQPFNFFY